ncbi:hypothetical protein [Streptomyces phaeoluteigriseus]|uniref:hypothetical protein n=1 Tax=Streptomyces phaeoluteigriseus TaxID=114686 RepID=UPI0036B5873F
MTDFLSRDVVGQVLVARDLPRVEPGGLKGPCDGACVHYWRSAMTSTQLCSLCGAAAELDPVLLGFDAEFAKASSWARPVGRRDSPHAVECLTDVMSTCTNPWRVLSEAPATIRA